MANIVDYLDWRGDLTWSRSPFNDVDSLLLCTLTYTDLEGVIPGLASDETVSLSEAAKRYFEIHTEEEIRSRTGFTSQVPLQILRVFSHFSRLLFTFSRNAPILSIISVYRRPQGKTIPCQHSVL